MESAPFKEIHLTTLIKNRFFFFTGMLIFISFRRWWKVKIHNLSDPFSSFLSIFFFSCQDFWTRVLPSKHSFTNVFDSSYWYFLFCFAFCSFFFSFLYFFFHSFSCVARSVIHFFAIFVIGLFSQFSNHAFVCLFVCWHICLCDGIWLLVNTRVLPPFDVGRAEWLITFTRAMTTCKHSRVDKSLSCWSLQQQSRESIAGGRCNNKKGIILSYHLVKFQEICDKTRGFSLEANFSSLFQVFNFFFVFSSFF